MRRHVGEKSRNSELNRDKLLKRNNLLKMISRNYNQFQSPRFIGQHRYAWTKAGLGRRPIIVFVVLAMWLVLDVLNVP